MPKALIKISYRQIVDTSSKGLFAQKVFDHLYQEFCLKSQAYNPEGKLATFSQLKMQDGRANSLHYKSGFAVAGFVEGLANQIPFLEDNAGQPLSFDTYRFEVIESDITNQQMHKVAIHYISGLLTLHEIIGETLLLSKDNSFAMNDPKPADTFMLKMQEVVSIIQYQEFAVLSKAAY